jgi:DNA-binding MarR family transcriptional regulator
MNPSAAAPRAVFTPRQGQYLAFILAYRRLHGRAPAEADIQRHFRVSAPAVHQMLLTLQKAGLITRQPGQPRSIVLTIDPAALPPLPDQPGQPVKFTVQSH